MTEDERPLDRETATKLATTLKLVPGFPWDDACVEATADDLILWCKPVQLHSGTWTAEGQARSLVRRAREVWRSWPGTAMLYEMLLAEQHEVMATNDKAGSNPSWKRAHENLQ